jgi:hypothetical protein
MERSPGRHAHNNVEPEPHIDQQASKCVPRGDVRRMEMPGVPEHSVCCYAKHENPRGSIASKPCERPEYQHSSALHPQPATRTNAAKEPSAREVDERHTRKEQRECCALNGNAAFRKQRGGQHHDKHARAYRGHATRIGKERHRLPGRDKVKAQASRQGSACKGEPFAGCLTIFGPCHYTYTTGKLAPNRVCRRKLRQSQVARQGGNDSSA